MQTSLNIERLRDLLADLHEITHLQISLHDTIGNEFYSIHSRSAFCDLICNTEEGYRMCVDCDMRAVAAFGELANPYEYRCHAGLIDTAIPITERGELVAIILFGQILDESPLEEQWARTRRLCAWHPQPRRLREAFMELPRLSVKQIRACYKIINACVSEMRLEGLLKADAETDAQRLKNYIHTHYASALSVAGIAEALSISRSRLYQLAAQLEEGLTINAMIARRRITVAKRLLAKPDAVVRDVAELVGIPDYNYFAKVFKKATGMTPSEYRSRREAEDAAP